MIKVEVIYAEAQEQAIYHVAVEEGATVEEAIRASGVLRVFPRIDLQNCGVGIYAKAASLSTLLKEGDRVEIYRPLIADPKEARRGRVKKA